MVSSQRTPNAPSRKFEKACGIIWYPRLLTVCNVFSAALLAPRRSLCAPITLICGHISQSFFIVIRPSSWAWRTPPCLLYPCQPALQLLTLLLILRLLLLLALHGRIRILDRQAPDIEVIANRPDDIDDKAAMHTNGKTQTHEHERNLINVITKRAGPADANMFLQQRTERVDDTVDERVHEHVATRESGLCQVRDDHTADGEGVDETGVEAEWDEMLAQDHGLEVEVRGNENPGGCESKETEECNASPLATGATSIHNVLGAVLLC